MDKQFELAFIDRNVEEDIIQQRLMDGYVNATALCKASGKKFNDYSRLKNTEEFINELSAETGIPATALIQVIQGGEPQFQGTWVHPQVAINLAQWASPKFAVLVSKWVLEWMQGKLSGKGNLPYHLQRYLLNRTKIPPSHFSIFNEITMLLIAPLEEKGYTLSDKLVPDISEGKVFADWLRKKKNIDPSNFPTYEHEYADGRKVQARLYPNELLPWFKEHFSNEWLMNYSLKYFKKRDVTALPYLQEFVTSLPVAQQTKLKKHIVNEPSETIKELNKTLKTITQYNPKKKRN